MRKVLLLLGVVIVVLGLGTAGVVLFLWSPARTTAVAERTPRAEPTPTPTPTPEETPEPEPSPEPPPAPETVIAEAAAPPEEAPREAPEPRKRRGSGRGYCVQLGAFVDPANAERLGEAARASGIEVTIVEHERAGELLLRVRTRDRGSREDARLLADAVRTKLGIEGWITS